MITERFLPVGNVKLRVLEDGLGSDTSAFVLIHGLAASATRWRDVMPHLARVRRTVALDLPGFGRSDSPDGSYSMAWLAGAVRATMDSAGIDRAVVIGNSMGGLVATHLAASIPSRVDAVVLAAPAFPIISRPRRDVLAGFVAPMIPYLGPRMYRNHVAARTPERLVREMLARNVSDPGKVPAETVEVLEAEVRDTASRPERARALERTNRALGWSMTAGRELTWGLARSLRAPVLVVWGERDQLLPVALGEATVKQIPGSQLVVLDGLGHNPYMEAPERFAHTVLTFIGEAPRIGVQGPG